MDNNELLEQIKQSLLSDLSKMSKSSEKTSEYEQTVAALTAICRAQTDAAEIGVKAMEAETKKFEAETKRLEAENNRIKINSEVARVQVEANKAQTDRIATFGNWAKFGLMLAQTGLMFHKTLDFDRAGGFIDCKNAWFQAQRGADRFFNLFRDK